MSNLIDIVIREMELRNLSKKTIQAYIRVIKDFYHTYRRPLRGASEDDLKEYLHAKQQSGLSAQTISLHANALNFLYREIYHQPSF